MTYVHCSWTLCLARLPNRLVITSPNDIVAAMCCFVSVHFATPTPCSVPLALRLVVRHGQRTTIDGQSIRIDRALACLAVDNAAPLTT